MATNAAPKDAGSIAKWRKIVAAIGAEGQRCGSDDGHQVKTSVEVRKQHATARGLPFQAVSKPGGIDTDEDEVALAGKVLSCSFADLFGRREMNEAVSPVHLRALEFSSKLGFEPERSGTNFIDQICHSGRLCSWTPNDYQAEAFPA